VGDWTIKDYLKHHFSNQQSYRQYVSHRAERHWGRVRVNDDEIDSMDSLAEDNQV
jgi:hypothetical protein